MSIKEMDAKRRDATGREGAGHSSVRRGSGQWNGSMSLGESFTYSYTPTTAQPRPTLTPVSLLSYIPSIN